MAERVSFRTKSGERVSFTAKKSKKSAKKRTSKKSTRKAAPKRKATRRAAPKRTRRTTTRRAAPKRRTTRRASPKRTRRAAPKRMRRSRAKKMCSPCASHAGGMNRKLEALKDYAVSNVENLKSRVSRAERTIGEHDRALAAVYSSGAKLLGSPQPRMPGIVRQSMPSRPVARAELRAPASRQLGSGR